MYEFEKRKEDERLSRVNAVIGTIIKDNSDTKMISIKKDELCDILTKQMTHKELEKHSERERSIQEEREYLDHVAIELDMQNASDRANHLAKQSTLLESWEREGHIKNLKKLQTSGINAVHGYMRTNLMDGTPDFNMTSYSARSDKSIGFDSRRR